MAAHHFRHAAHDVADGLFGNDKSIGEDAGRGLEDLPAGVADEAGDHEGRDWVQPQVPHAHADQRRDHRCGRQQVAGRVMGIGHQHFADEPAPGRAFVEHHAEVDQEGGTHDHEREPRDDGLTAGLQTRHRRRHDLKQHQQQEDENAHRRHGLELAVTIRMVIVRGLAGDAHADQRHDVRCRVGEGVEAVRPDADRAR